MAYRDYAGYPQNMSNQDRRRKRRERRDMQRAQRRANREQPYTTLLDMNTLYRAAHEAANGVRWKTATQSYELRLLAQLSKTRGQLANGENITMPLKRFDLMERGKLRHIQAAKFPEKVIQKALTTQILRPAYTPTFTTGNSANMKGRGTMYAIKRLKRQLVHHYHIHGRDGYILLIDFSDYFATVPHAGIIQQAARNIHDRDTRRLISQLVNRENGTRGLGLGSEPAQVFAVAYPNRLDHWITQYSRCEATGRYMDDTYVLDVDKQRLRNVLDSIRSMSAAMGLRLNSRKTHIVKLSHGFTWLKKKWSITEAGRIIIRPSRKMITRERRKLKKLTRQVLDGRLTVHSFEMSYISWRGGLNHYEARRSQQSTDRIYVEALNRIYREAGTGRV